MLRPDTAHPEPSHKLSEAERERMVRLCDERRLPPSQIVPRLADEGAYVASQSSFIGCALQGDKGTAGVRQADGERTAAPSGDGVEHGVDRGPDICRLHECGGQEILPVRGPGLVGPRDRGLGIGTAPGTERGPGGRSLYYSLREFCLNGSAQREATFP